MRRRLQVLCGCCAAAAVLLGVAPFAGAAGAAGAGKWVSLFDGKTLTGWERKAVHGGNGGLWEVKDGALVANQEPDHGGGLLGTTTPFGDFEIELEFLADEPADSGLFLRTSPDGTGYQLTIDIRKDGSVGSLYVPGTGFAAEDKEWRSKYRPGKWNQLRAVITGGAGEQSPTHIVAYLNGKKTVEYTEPTTQGGGRNVPRQGYVGLQVHSGGGAWGQGCHVRFRKIRLRPLTEALEKNNK